MREELFDNEEEKEKYDYFGEIIRSKKLKELNPNISDDLEILQNHYSIILDYVIELEEKLKKYRKKVDKLNRKLHYFENLDLEEKDRDRKIEKLEKELQDAELLLFYNLR